MKLLFTKAINTKPKQAGFLAMGLAMIFTGVVGVFTYNSSQESSHLSRAISDFNTRELLHAVNMQEAGAVGLMMEYGWIKNSAGGALEITDAGKKAVTWKKKGGALQKQACLDVDTPLENCDKTKKVDLSLSVVNIEPPVKDADGNSLTYYKLRLDSKYLHPMTNAEVENKFSFLALEPGQVTYQASTECKYEDPAVKFVPQYVRHIWPGRFHVEGWAKIKPPPRPGSGHAWQSNFPRDGGYNVSVSEFRITYGYSPEHNWVFPKSTSTFTARNFYFRLSGWPFWGSLIIPKGRENECFFFPASFRKNAWGVGCFAAGTMIHVSKDKAVEVQTLQKGDYVYNPITDRRQKLVEVVAGPEEQDLFRFSFNDSELVVTYDHPMTTKRGVVMAAEVTANDQILIEGNKWVAATIETLPSHGQTVYNFVLEGDHQRQNHMILANGVVTGDLYLQRRIKKENENSAWKLAAAASHTNL